MKKILFGFICILYLISCNKKPSASATFDDDNTTVINIPSISILVIDVVVLNQPFQFDITDWTKVVNNQTVNLTSRTLPLTSEIKVEVLPGTEVVVNPPDANNVFNIVVTSADHTQTVTFRIAWQKNSLPTDSIIEMIGLNILNTTGDLPRNQDFYTDFTDWSNISEGSFIGLVTLTQPQASDIQIFMNYNGTFKVTANAAVGNNAPTYTVQLFSEDQSKTLTFTLYWSATRAGLTGIINLTVPDQLDALFSVTDWKTVRDGSVVLLASGRLPIASEVIITTENNEKTNVSVNTTTGIITVTVISSTGNEQMSFEILWEETIESATIVDNVTISNDLLATFNISNWHTLVQNQVVTFNSKLKPTAANFVVTLPSLSGETSAVTVDPTTPNQYKVVITSKNGLGTLTFYLLENIVVQSLNCGVRSFNPVYVPIPSEGTAYTGTLTVSYSSGNGTTFPAGTAINSTGITGLTATLRTGTLANNANGNLIFDLSGTPSGLGTANFALNFGGKTCSVNKSIASYFTASIGNRTGVNINMFSENSSLFNMPLNSASILQNGQEFSYSNDPFLVTLPGAGTYNLKITYLSSNSGTVNPDLGIIQVYNNANNALVGTISNTGGNFDFTGTSGERLKFIFKNNCTDCITVLTSFTILLTKTSLN